jgi:hypothetical protein
LVLVGALTVVVMTRSTGSSSSSTTTTAGAIPVSSAGGPQPTVPPGTASPTEPASATVLGKDVPLLRDEPCRRPSSADGSAWQYTAVSLEGREFDAAYWCNIFFGSVGSLQFDLAKKYRTLRMTIGFLDTSTAIDHSVTYDFIGDETEHLIPPRTITFGTVADLDINVMDVTRLELRITETHQSRGSDAASQPAFASPTLTAV